MFDQTCFQCATEQAVKARISAAASIAAASRKRASSASHVLRWRRGTQSCGSAYHVLVELAPWIPGGLDVAHLLPSASVRSRS